MALRHALTTFLGVAGLVALVLGLMYLFANGALPYLLQGSAHTGHHVKRATLCLIAGGACLVVAWLIRAPRDTAGSGGPS
jgi:membrane-bound ClpP family serine protease